MQYKGKSSNNTRQHANHERASCDMQTIKNHCGRQLEKCRVSWTFVTLTVHLKTGLELPKCSHIILFFCVTAHSRLFPHLQTGMWWQLN